MDYSKPASSELIEKTIDALAKNGISAEVVESKEHAKETVLSLIPSGAEVMTMTSITLQETGIAEALNTDEQYVSVQNELNTLSRETHHMEMQKLGAAPEWVVGSVHAVTEDGKILVASNTGSQLPAYAYGSTHVIWVVGAQKIVKDMNQAMERLDYIIPLESARARKAYGLPEEWNTFPSKLLIFNKEQSPKRIHVIFIKEAAGF